VVEATKHNRDLYMGQAFSAPFLASLCAAAVTAAGIAFIRRYEERALGNAECPLSALLGRDFRPIGNEGELFRTNS
jgi:hypothetical protein